MRAYNSMTNLEFAFKIDFVEKLMAGEFGEFDALNKYLYFSAENKRYFDTVF